jgi:hypothetical protein
MGVNNLQEMKKGILSGLLLGLALVAFCQEREYQTLFSNQELKISGMGGPFMQFTTVAGEFGHMMGGGGAVIVNDFFFGGYGMGLTNPIPDHVNLYNTEDRLSLGHGGFWLGYTLFGDRPLHLTVSTLVGWGEFGIIQRGEYYPYVRDNIFVFSPIVELELNLTRFFRIGVGATYNLYGMVDLEGYRSSDLSSPGGFLSFKFGWFK